MRYVQPGKTIPSLRPFTILIGSRTNPRMSFEVMAANAQRAGEQADGLALPGERTDVLPLPLRDVQLAAQFSGTPSDLPLETADLVLEQGYLGELPGFGSAA